MTVTMTAAENKARRLIERIKAARVQAVIRAVKKERNDRHG